MVRCEKREYVDRGEGGDCNKRIRIRIIKGANEIAQQLGALAGDPSLILSTHVRQFTTIWNSGSNISSF